MRYITALKLGGFRCFADSPSVELNHLTVLAGPNSSGKSAFLASIRRLSSVELGRHALRGTPAGVAFSGSVTHLRLDAKDPRESESKTTVEISIDPNVFDAAGGRVATEPAPPPMQLVAEFEAGRPSKVFVNGANNMRIKGVDRDAVNALQLIVKLPIVVIPDRRSFRKETLTANAPAIREEIVEPALLPDSLVAMFCEERDKFEEWQQLTSDLLGVQVAASLRPSRGNRILVSCAGEPQRDLDDVGSGIVEVMNLALALTKYAGGLLLFEEPELHLHPKIQRRVMEMVERYCTARQWQAVVTTHSNHVLDYQTANIATYSVERSHDKSVVTKVSSRPDWYELLADLGVRPSSIVQANTVVWVEGPSDATYLRFFLEERGRTTGTEIREYLDYSFAYFGGALLRHASAAIAPIQGLVDFLSIHPRSYVVVDSDRTAKEADLGKNYTREFLASSLPGKTWVTDGREIENYLTDEVLMWAVTGDTDTDGSQTVRTNDRAYMVFAEQVKAVREAKSRSRSAHDASDPAKSQFAREATLMMKKKPEVDWLRQLDLKQQLDQLIAFVRKAAVE